PVKPPPAPTPIPGTNHYIHETDEAGQTFDWPASSVCDRLIRRGSAIGPK
ncbi:MAG: hypothetical protein QOJ80_6395, partial [Mycobacterium sp.]|nr:hypothetical protein [Mycobacterium sp.]